MIAVEWLHSRVLVRRGRREGERGTVVAVRNDGSLSVSFVIPVGGGTEQSTYLTSDLTRLGLEVEFEPIRNCFGDDPLQRLRTGPPAGGRMATEHYLRISALAGAMSRVGDINEPPLRDALDYIRELGEALTKITEHPVATPIAGRRYLGLEPWPSCQALAHAALARRKTE